MPETAPVSEREGTGVIDSGHPLDGVTTRVASYENGLRGDTFDVLSRQGYDS